MWFGLRSCRPIVVLYQVAGVLPAQTPDRSWPEGDTNLRAVLMRRFAEQRAKRTDEMESRHVRYCCDCRQCQIFRGSIAQNITSPTKSDKVGVPHDDNASGSHLRFNGRFRL